MALSIRKLAPRLIAGKNITPQKVVQEKYFVRLINNNVKYAQLVESLRGGITATAVAAYWARQGWIDVNERTFTEAIRVWKKLHPEILDSKEAIGIDKIVEPNQPFGDELHAAEQLLAVQKIRLGIGVSNEQNFQMLLKDNAKEIEVTTKLIETIAKIKGKIVDGGGRGSAPEPQNVVEDLSKVKKDETARDRLHNMVKQVLEVKA